MISFIKKPNLPEHNVESVICGELPYEIASFLQSRKIRMIKQSPNNFVDPAVSLHPDMACLHLGSDKLIADKSQTRLIRELTDLGFEVVTTAREIRGEYPQDIGLNFTVIGNTLIGNLKYADASLEENTKQFNKINCRQGYCKCSSLVLRENALITDDNSIHKICLKNGIDSLLVSKGDVSLPGYEYGFIGGASVKISADEVLFFGDITKHRSYNEINAFCEKYNIKIISLPMKLTDYGSMIPLTEKA